MNIVDIPEKVKFETCEKLEIYKTTAATQFMKAEDSGSTVTLSEFENLDIFLVYL